MISTSMGRTCSVMVGVAGWGALTACLVENPRFVESTDGGSSESPPASTSQGMSGSSSSTGAAEESTTTGGQNCSEDPYEPNDDEFAASDLGPLLDDAPPLSVQAVLETAASEDWYRYLGQAMSGLPPAIEARALTRDGAALTVCAFVQCASGAEATEATCAEGSDEHTHTVGDYAPGCCGRGSVGVQPMCSSGSLDDLSVLIRVTVADELDQCIDYLLTYAF